MTAKHCFVENIPEKLEQGTVYVSIDYSIAVHKCFCGCGFDVVTPFSPAEWSLTYDGETITLYPSIGNWSFACQSHYWIRKGRVEWAGKFSEDKIALVRQKDGLAKSNYYDQNLEKQPKKSKSIQSRLKDMLK